MTKLPPGEGDQTFDPEKYEKSLKNVTEIAQLLSEKLTLEEMYLVVLAIEDPDFHEAVIRKWKDAERANKQS